MTDNYQNAAPIHPELPDTAVPKRKNGYHLDKIPCCVVLQDASNNNVLVLNDTSALVWRLCNGDINVGEMISMICDCFTAPHDLIVRDIYRTLDTFKMYELVDIDGV